MTSRFILFFVGSITIFESAFSQESVDSVLLTVQAERLYGLSFTQAERDSMQKNLLENLEHFESLHNYTFYNSIPPALVFNPIPIGFNVAGMNKGISDFGLPQNVKVPANKEELAFYTVAQLSVLIKSRKITSEELTNIYLNRIKKYSDTLECMITLLEERAIAQARKADIEISEGNYRGPLHGIPYGIKDLFALNGYKTTWGAMPYKDQMIDDTATVIEKLDDAGAVLIAKLTLGALAMGDVWYGGRTRNPWNMQQGSSGSSAGSGSATAAGLVAFAIGTETLGSIVSPSTRNGVTGLRPTFGRVSRSGAMALSWSMDKIGPMCRSAQDAALVFNVIYGPDGEDQSVIEAPFSYEHKIDFKDLKMGYFKNLFDRNYNSKVNDSVSLAVFRNLGADLQEISLPDNIPYNSMFIILAAEAGAAFDELTRSGEDDLLVRQDVNAWPNFFRSSRFIPAVEYIQANRLRFTLIQEMNKIFSEYDVVITPTFGGPQLLATNLTGNPVVCIPNGFNSNGGPTSISILGGLFQEGKILAIANAYQQATEFDEMHPDYFIPEKK